MEEAFKEIMDSVYRTQPPRVSLDIDADVRTATHVSHESEIVTMSKSFVLVDKVQPVEAIRKKPNRCC